MENYIPTLLMVLFGISMVLMAFGPKTNYEGFWLFLNDIADSSKNIWESLINSFLNVNVLIGAGITTLAVAYLTGSATAGASIRAFILAALVNWFFYPMSMIRAVLGMAVGDPVVSFLGVAVLGFLSILLALGIADYVGG